MTELIPILRISHQAFDTDHDWYRCLCDLPARCSVDRSINTAVFDAHFCTFIKDYVNGDFVVGRTTEEFRMLKALTMNSKGKATPSKGEEDPTMHRVSSVE